MTVAETITGVAPQVQTPEITLTLAAAEAVRGLLRERKLEGHALRVFVTAGSCSGYEYGMALEANPRESDLIVEQHGVRVVVDEVSLGYLRGSNIDYVSDVMTSGFKIDNPNVTSCECGHSFHAKGEESGHHHHGEGGCDCH